MGRGGRPAIAASMSRIEFGRGIIEPAQSVSLQGLVGRVGGRVGVL
jgi:hypothetical protein